jgi:hypothetical protein
MSCPEGSGDSEFHQFIIAEQAETFTPKDRRKKRFDDAVADAILAAELTRDASDTVPILGPLKALMTTLITLLKHVRVGITMCNTSHRTKWKTRM